MVTEKHSPFPGMDPFIEACGRWSGFHAKLIAALEETLSRVVPERYFVDIGERFYVVLAAGTEEEVHDRGSVSREQEIRLRWLEALHAKTPGLLRGRLHQLRRTRP